MRGLACGVLLSCCALGTVVQAEPLTDEHKGVLKRVIKMARETAKVAYTSADKKRAKDALQLCDMLRGIVKASDSKSSNYWNAEIEYCYGFVKIVAYEGTAPAVKQGCPHLRRAFELAEKALNAGEEVEGARDLVAARATALKPC